MTPPDAIPASSLLNFPDSGPGAVSEGTCPAEQT